MRHSIFRFIAAFLPVLALAGCQIEGPFNRVSGDAIKVVGVAVPFAEGNATKSVMNETESYIVNMALYVFDSDGNKVDYQFIESSKPLFIIDRQQAPYSTHDQSKMASCTLYILANIPEEDRGLLASLATESAFLNTDCTIAGVLRESGIRTAGGLPMWGSKKWADDAQTQPIDLRSTSTALNGAVLQLHLNTFMAKMKFNITVDPVQKSEFVQRFELKSWTIENVPAKARVAQPVGTAESAHRDGPFFTTTFTFGNVDNGVNPIMQGGSTPMSFWCYVPEHRVLPGGSVTYPAGMPETDKQNLKPDWVTDSDRPLKITLKGIYTDHRNIEKAVEYTIYPGSDNWKDFYVDRNHEYLNNITIMGISNSKDGLNVSLDMRVDVQQNDFSFTLERETLLDSHWEIRPVRIALDPAIHPEADRVEVEVMEDDLTHAVPSWIRFESPSTSQISSAPSTYCDAAPGSTSYGKRRYFTDNLVSSTLSANKKITIEADDPSNTGIANEHAIWVYIDENTDLPSSPGSTNRKAKVQCRYYVNGQADPKVVEDYYFMQKSLHNITYNSHTYGIEYYEEYLYNFDAREQYGKTTDGMAWGLENLSLSRNDPAVYLKSLSWTTSGWFGESFKDDIEESLTASFNSIPETYKARYDFYLTRDKVENDIPDGKITLHDYGGKLFTNRIVSYVRDYPQESFPLNRPTNVPVESAAEYCYNKNKRDASGNVTNIKWYLPSIDEIEDITSGGYGDFEVFQDKLYWSSQPAYKKYSINYSGSWTPVGESTGWDFSLAGSASATTNGMMFQDNSGKARATRISSTGGTFNNVKSTPKANSGSLSLTQSGTATFRVTEWFFIIPVGFEITAVSPGVLNDGGGPTSTSVEYEEGACDRTEVHRVRCVYKN